MMKIRNNRAKRPKTEATAMAHHFFSESSVSKKITTAENAVISKPEKEKEK